jgi:hypothetical protein
MLSFTVGRVWLLRLAVQQPILGPALPCSAGDRIYQRGRFHYQSILARVITILRAVLRMRWGADASAPITTVSSLCNEIF